MNLDLNYLKHVPTFKRIAIISLSIALTIAILVLCIYHQIEKRFESITQYQSKTTQFLLSNIDYKTERLRITMFTRDFIMKSNKKISFDEAFFIASSNVKWCEIYPSQDPLLKLALQWHETGGTFNRKIKSPMGAVGLNQVMPYNARLLCRGYGIAYTDTMLYDVEFNNRVSSQLFEEGLAQYKSYDVTLACYNGGPLNAYKYLNNLESIANETKNYVPDVLKKYEQLKEMYMTYHLNMNDLFPDTIKIKKGK